MAPWATLQASQAPPQAVSQQTPSAQKFELHSPAAPQLTPLAFFAAHQVPLHQVPDGHPLAQGIGQSASVPLHTTAPPQAGLPGSPEGAGPQVPAWAPSQRSQEPAQALLQQTPSAQKPLRHWAPAAQVAPFPLSGVQVPSQKKPAAQWA